MEHLWFVKHKNILRGMILLLLIISLLGPWAIDQINVPAQYTCSPPNVRLYGDFCGVPVTGVKVFGWLFIWFPYMLLEMIKATFAGRFRELLVMLYIPPLIPFFTTLLLIWKKEPRRLPTINLIAWILAFLLTLTIFISQINDPVFRLWGPWLYIIAAISAIIIEGLILVEERKSAR
jgi:hypothetical protein